MAVHGTLPEFSGKDWSSYVDRLGFYFEANDIIADTNAINKQRAILLSVIGTDTYTLLRSLTAPRTPAELTYKELCDLLSSHYEPKPNAILQRYNFYSAYRKQGQSIKDFVAELKGLARNCDFGKTRTGVILTEKVILEENLRDRLVCGVADTAIQRRLLGETDLSFDKSYQLALAMESAATNAAQLHSKDTTVYYSNADKVSAHKQSSRKPNKSALTHSQAKACYRCGKTTHLPSECRFKDTECRFCKKVGHIESNCFAKKNGPKNRTHHMRATKSEESQGLMYSLYTVKGPRPDPIITSLNVDGQILEMEVDTGATLSIVSEETWRRHWTRPRPRLEQTHDTLRTYTGQCVKIKGIVDVKVEGKKGECHTLPLMVVPGNGPSLLGRNWLSMLQLDWTRIHHVGASSSTRRDDGSQTSDKKRHPRLEALLQKYDGVFKDSHQAAKTDAAKIYVEENATPKYFKARPLPYVMRDMVDKELDRLLADDIIEAVQYSDWAAPVVPVMKADKSVRLCGDYKLTVNQVAKLDRYPIPKIEDLYAQLGNGTSYTKLDMRHAYEQIELHPDSRKYVTINTARGLFTYKRLPYGVSSAPGIYQRVMDSLLKGIKNTMVYLDDVLITGKTDEEHLQALDLVMERLMNAGFCLKKQKCHFMVEEVEYLGHRIDALGIHPSGHALTAVRDAPAPVNVAELRSYLGMVNHYGRFVSNLATVLAPLHQLLRKEMRWRWSKAQQDAFTRTKEMLSSPQVMTHFDSSKPLVLTCDASPYGVGAVLAHAFDDGVERPIAYYSRSLSAAEKNYAQIDKEGLAVIAGLARFHQYLWGRPFVIVTDHKPLLGLFGEQKAVPQMLSPRMQRWALTLAAYEYQIVHRPGSSIPQADALSRLPLGGAPTHVPVPGETILAMQYMDMSPVTSSDIRNETRRDATLSQVFMRTRDGFPQHEDNELLKPYHQRRTELSITDGCLMWGARVIIPSRYRKAMLEELHNAHSGIVRMKAVGRSFMWWPGFDSDIERTVNSCDICRRSRHKPIEAPLQPWSFPDRPWSRVHIDYAGPVMGKMILVVIDAHSKWIEAYTTSGSTSAITINKLKWIFSSHGIPHVIVSDNATGFVSEEFQSFCRRNGIKHVTSAPHHPATNGLAERAVGILKGGVQRLEGDLETRIAHFLLDYRITPHSTTGVSPAELLIGRKLRTRLDRIIPDVAGRAIMKQTIQKERHDQHTQARQYQPGDLVYALMYRGNKTSWTPGMVVTQTGPVSYTVRLEDGTISRRHIDQLQSRLLSSQVVREPPIYVEEPRPQTIPPIYVEEPRPRTIEPESSEAEKSDIASPLSAQAPARSAQPTDCTPPESEVELRRSTRVRQQPRRLDL